MWKVRGEYKEAFVTKPMPELDGEFNTFKQVSRHIEKKIGEKPRFLFLHPHNGEGENLISVNGNNASVRFYISR